MLLSTAIPLAAIFVSPVWAQLNKARCAAGFDWVCNTLAHSSNEGVIIERQIMNT